MVFWNFSSANGEKSECQIRNREVQWQEQCRDLEGEDARYSHATRSGEGSFVKRKETSDYFR
jgi:hypothetical protein